MSEANAAGGLFKKISYLINTTPALRATPLNRGGEFFAPRQFIHTFYDRRRFPGSRSPAVIGRRYSYFLLRPAAGSLTLSLKKSSSIGAHSSSRISPGCRLHVWTSVTHGFV